MCYHQFLAQVEEHDRSGELIAPLPCRYCNPKAYKEAVAERAAEEKKQRRK